MKLESVDAVVWTSKDSNCSSISECSDSASLSAEGRYLAMDTQIRNTSGFANNLWVQMAVLFIAVGGLIALAAKFIW
jgi:hypothetical protein